MRIKAVLLMAISLCALGILRHRIEPPSDPVRAVFSQLTTAKHNHRHDGNGDWRAYLVALEVIDLDDVPDSIREEVLQLIVAVERCYYAGERKRDVQLLKTRVAEDESRCIAALARASSRR